MSSFIIIIYLVLKQKIILAVEPIYNILIYNIQKSTLLKSSYIALSLLYVDSAYEKKWNIMSVVVVDRLIVYTTCACLKTIILVIMFALIIWKTTQFYFCCSNDMHNSFAKLIYN